MSVVKSKYVLISMMLYLFPHLFIYIIFISIKITSMTDSLEHLIVLTKYNNNENPLALPMVSTT